MSESHPHDTASMPTEPSAGPSPGDDSGPSAQPAAEQLPPVEPPSAGFIVQLFLVPALIVLVVVGVWALFGNLAGGETDWEKLVAEVGSENTHIRWRAALQLAHLLSAGGELDEQGRQLAENPRVARELARLFREQFGRRSDVSEDDLKQLVYLARTLGALDVPEETLPALREAIRFEDSSDKYRDVRREAIFAVATIAGRMAESDRPLDSPELIADLIAVSHEPDPMLRQMAAYMLGLLEDEAAQERLRVLLDDRDVKTRVNAAVGLARQDSTAGYDVFKAVLDDAASNLGKRSSSTNDDDAQADRFESLLVLKNTLKAVDSLAEHWTAQQRAELIDVLESIADGYSERTMRLEAGQLRDKLATLGG